MATYLEMLRQRDGMPMQDEALVHAFRWTLLAGFLLLPGTFDDLKQKASGDWSEELTPSQESMLILGWLFSGMSVFGLIWLWKRYRQNYVWVLDSIFMPTFFYSLTGIASAISNIFAGGWKFTGTGLSALVVACVAVPICATMTLVYMFKLRRVKAKFKREQKRSTVEYSAYDKMLLENQRITTIAAWTPRIFTWMLLAGFVMLPGTFKTELQDSVVSSIGLFTSAWVFSGLGALGLCWIVWYQRTNYGYLSNFVFVQTFEHSVMGLVTTLATLYGAHQGYFTPASRSTLIVTSAVSLLCLVMTIACLRMKRMLRTEHYQATEQAQAQKTGASDEEKGGTDEEKAATNEEKAATNEEKAAANDERAADDEKVSGSESA